MGAIRNGARTFLNILNKACKLSHFPGFRPAVIRILGSDNASTLFGLWDPLCLFVEELVAADNWYNQIDFRIEAIDGEDRGVPA